MEASSTTAKKYKEEEKLVVPFQIGRLGAALTLTGEKKKGRN